jgi:hypothetical protein
MRTLGKTDEPRLSRKNASPLPATTNAVFPKKAKIPLSLFRFLRRILPSSQHSTFPQPIATSNLRQHPPLKLKGNIHTRASLAVEITKGVTSTTEVGMQLSCAGWRLRRFQGCNIRRQCCGEKEGVGASAAADFQVCNIHR